MRSILVARAFAAIAEHYGTRCAARSYVPLINHIKEGVHILEMIKADDATIAAYCLHPLIQNDEDLVTGLPTVISFPPLVIAYVMEYRRTANAWLSTMPMPFRPKSPIDQVNDMLIADKVQNRKDFEIHHKDIHARSDELDAYFKAWLGVLGVDDWLYQDFVSRL